MNLVVPTSFSFHVRITDGVWKVEVFSGHESEHYCAQAVFERFPGAVAVPTPARLPAPKRSWLDLWSSEDAMVADMDQRSFTRTVAYVEAIHPPGLFTFSPELWMPAHVRERLASVLGGPVEGRDN